MRTGVVSSTLQSGAAKRPRSDFADAAYRQSDIYSFQLHETGITMDSSIGNKFSSVSNFQTNGIGPQQHDTANQNPSSAGSEQQLDQLLAMLIMMLMQQSQGSEQGNETSQGSGGNGGQQGSQAMSPLTQLLMGIITQLMQGQNGAGSAGNGSFGSSFNSNLSTVTGQA
ncbi:XopA/Hpa1 family type III secretion system protein [Xanthomonas fragariae]|uniref:XopA/Hpa1 family type III secretion system protein n=1 Tax=Xanthomonas fragariae TaxID=48664 RepID=UPI001EDDE984|nr:XopA/Hpa1 family type III secretion system protein [Xanthomonas fragariae]